MGYALVSLLICCTGKQPARVFGSEKVEYDASRHAFGLSLFAVGLVGNFYHHLLLSKLRVSASGEESITKNYLAPRGGLFAYVATPHYLFELVGWLGIAVASQQLTSYLNLISMACYLCARGYNQNQWNKKRFNEKDWPPSRKNMIPYL